MLKEKSANGRPAIPEWRKSLTGRFYLELFVQGGAQLAAQVTSLAGRGWLPKRQLSLASCKDVGASSPGSCRDQAPPPSFSHPPNVAGPYLETLLPGQWMGLSQSFSTSPTHRDCPA